MLSLPRTDCFTSLYPASSLIHTSRILVLSKSDKLRMSQPIDLRFISHLSIDSTVAARHLYSGRAEFSGHGKKAAQEASGSPQKTTSASYCNVTST